MRIILPFVRFTRLPAFCQSAKGNGRRALTLDSDACGADQVPRNPLKICEPAGHEGLAALCDEAKRIAVTGCMLLYEFEEGPSGVRERRLPTKYEAKTAFDL